MGIGETICGFVVVAAGGLLGWVQFFVARRDRRIEHERRVAAEAKALAAEEKIAQMRRRGAAPYLAACLDRFHQLYVPSRDENGVVDPKQVGFVNPGGNRLLCYMRQEVPRDIPERTPIYFVIENRNQAATRATLKLDGVPIEFGQEPDISDAAGRYFLLYPYSPENHGKTQKLELWFEAKDGFQDTHVYELIHGVRSLRGGLMGSCRNT